jgi:hypothetical protein
MEGSKINGKYIQLLKMHQPKENLFSSCIMSCEITSAPLNLQLQWQITKLRAGHVTKLLLCRAWLFRLRFSPGSKPGRHVSLSLFPSGVTDVDFPTREEAGSRAPSHFLFSEDTLWLFLDFLTHQDGEAGKDLSVWLRGAPGCVCPLSLHTAWVTTENWDLKV